MSDMMNEAEAQGHREVPEALAAKTQWDAAPGRARPPETLQEEGKYAMRGFRGSKGRNAHRTI